MLNRLALKIGLLFFVFIIIIESVLFLTLYVTFVNERVDEVMTNLLARGNTHSEVLEDSFEPATLNHVALMESASDFIVIITDADGNELTHSDLIEPEMREVLEHTDFDEVLQGGKVVEERWDKKEFIATDSPITIEGEHRGHVFMFAETNHIKGMVSHLRNQFLIVGLIAVGLTVITIFLLSRLITLPLIRMKEATEQLSEGHHEVSLNIGRNDELGELANAITALSSDLEHLKNERNEFLASISHELRTPLTYIKGYADIASRPDASEEEKKEYIGIIREETAHLTELIRQLFELAQMDHNQFAIQKEGFSLEMLFASVVALVRPAFDEKQISLAVHCEHEIVAFIDPERFQQVLLNVLDNARKHSPEGTQVVLQGVQDKGTITISIRDEGEGIPEKDLPFVFERLYRVDKSRSRQYGGSGLGLAIAKEIVESHGGLMTLQSEYGQGTTVLIELKRGDSLAESAVG
ncbi:MULTISPECIES: HAMP domain-containing sensor histidine kinase [unclassified Planococcus (in: firmicutes)]|uniref:sensor histidine kinase n=1 Tax=unclassified Planococcus (in: firmicutes) TaxID=2662419 RepID=UPI000C342715|nr:MULTISPECIES: HAMP domain-containing sensor histidine kinase [unclassified Planococcus (in: firmicutes)]MDN5710153.1 HAMP domain-containing histidine kinase [Planococcus sp. (in: firmicutes)]AUD14920.1 two-component sensor histidine kinase [Planococcus sp. MB-3u-03]PKG45245.1 two-component sensor histidine kinase [Planococcus sp. Urea-trap-24]PKG87587.1 two-component sensor histidine kinase [Planococcus sp. Urea-3u-39]PKH41578.1 two-component sensor histidine kinase [Planococcus sp. MB-3u-0